MEQRSRSVRRRTRGLVAALAGLSLLAGACGGGDDTTDSTKAPEAPDTTPGATEPQAAPDTTPTDGTVAPTEPTETVVDTTVLEAPEPTAGGSLIFGIEADSSNPWRPSEVTCAISCHQVLRSVYDTLTILVDGGQFKPYLASAVTPNADFTEWTITAREGVKFHDGTAFDGAAIAENLNRHKTALLTGVVFKDVTSIEVSASDPMSAVVKVAAPWGNFPWTLSGQIGYMASPTWLAASDADETLKSKPVGTGPFVYDSYTPNESYKGVRNAEYWNAPYPYLDSIEFRPIPDALNRRDALKSGTVDVIHSTNGETIAEFRESKELPMIEITDHAETGYTMLHVTQDGSPLQDKRVRCALAYAVDQQAIIDTISAGVNKIANGPFSPEQTGYLEDNGYPLAQDMAKAQELIAEYKAENPGELALALATTQDETNLTIAQFQKDWFEEAGVDVVTLDQIDQGNYIVQALLGNFQLFQWRNHGGYDLDQQYIWWHSASSLEVGALALNFGRIKDANLDALLDENRALDPVAGADRKKAIAEEVSKLFATECYNLWGSYTVWSIIHQPKVQLASVSTPEGETILPGAGIAGSLAPISIWIQQ